jgi:hypothetical protein
MNNETSFRRIAAITAIISALFMLTSNVVTSMAVDFNFEFLANPVGLLTAGLDPGALGLFRMGEILGVFGYCLLFIPLTIYLWYWLRPRNPGLVTLYTVLGLMSIVFGVIEYGVRISIWPPLMIAYPHAVEAQREVLAVVFTAVTDFTFEGMYALSSVLFGLWWLGIGLILRNERRILGIATAIMGVAILGAGIGWFLRVEPLARLELFYFFVPFWALWLGLVIWQRGEQSEQMMETATAV